MLEQVLECGFAQMGIAHHAETALPLLRSYYEALSEKNKVMNLTAISGEEDTARLHFLDSAAPLQLFSFAGKRVIDVGTGAGFPGLPLKILQPEMELTLLDSLQKRIAFLQELCDALNLQGVECVHARAEDCSARRETYDFALSRAVARLNVLCELCLPYVRVGGCFLALKGPAAEAEAQEAAGAIAALGGALEQIHSYDLPGEAMQHRLVVIRKTQKTPKAYPRRFALIKKSPL